MENMHLTTPDSIDSFMGSEFDTRPVVTALQVSDADRLKALPKHYRQHAPLMEMTIYRYLDELSPDYRGGYWEMYELSNNGFYMAPTGYQTLRIAPSITCYHGDMSADAAGITATMFALGYLFEVTGNQELLDHQDRLYDYIANHPEGSAIYSALD